MTAGEMAAMVAVDAIAAGDTSASFLTRYEESWRTSMRRKLQRNHRLREKFSPKKRTDRIFVRAFALSVGG